MNTDLPVVKEKKKIDIKKFEKLAKKVKRIFEDEEKYLIEKSLKNGNSKASRISITS